MLEMCYEYDTLGRNVFLEAWSPLFVLFCLRCISLHLCRQHQSRRQAQYVRLSLWFVDFKICSGAAPKSPQLSAATNSMIHQLYFHQRKQLNWKNRRRAIHQIPQ